MTSGSRTQWSPASAHLSWLRGRPRKMGSHLFGIAGTKETISGPWFESWSPR